MDMKDRVMLITAIDLTRGGEQIGRTMKTGDWARSDSQLKDDIERYASKAQRTYSLIAECMKEVGREKVAFLREWEPG
jgi:hypothetical protein